MDKQNFSNLGNAIKVVVTQVGGSKANYDTNFMLLALIGGGKAKL